MSYMETIHGIDRNQTIMQIGMGGGMKAGINMWRALRDVRDNHAAWQHLRGRPVTGEPCTAQAPCRQAHKCGHQLPGAASDALPPCL